MSYGEVVRKHVSEAAAKNIETWLSEPKYAEYKDELLHLIEAGEWEKLEDSFFKTIEFGTGGRRGTTGIGPNRINKVTIGESAQALCEYLTSQDITAAKRGIVLAYDTRLSSPELSRYAARVFAANGFTTYLFDGFRATPELSFAVRHLRAAAGIVISASHNPPADNGFKAYWTDGGQLVPPHDSGVLAVAETITEIKTIEYDKAVSEGKIKLIGKEVDDAYISAVVNEAEGIDREVAIVYSPLHGAGQTSVLPVMKAAGFMNISLVSEQMLPDGNFPTIKNHKPNPEEQSANDMAVTQMLAERADIAITNDPDADRIGLMVRQNDQAVYLNGNQQAVLAADFSLAKLLGKNQLTSKHYIAKTIVTTDMLNSLADHYGINIYDNMLIGFKHIGELLLKKEDSDEVFVMGGEESYGLLKGTYTRDKDGAVGALLLAEYAAELKKQGKTLYDRLLELYIEHGLYVEYLTNTYFPGASGFNKMQKVMLDLRAQPPAEIGGHDVTAVLDYQTLKRRDVKTGEETAIDCLAGNVIVLELNGDSRRRVTIRPSGTEPKLKFYIQWFDEVKDIKHVREEYNAALTMLQELAKTLEEKVLE